MRRSPGFLTHPLLTATGAWHGFGTRRARAPEGLVRPRQVHGTRVARRLPGRSSELDGADAIVSCDAATPVGVATADCVPILIAVADARVVAAVHAGWRGLARGVVGAALEVLAEFGIDTRELRAVVGPCAGPCCYEVDALVLDALAPRFGEELERALVASRPAHARLDLGALAGYELARLGVPADAIGFVPDACTICDATRFHSYRRDGRRAGRLLHFVQARALDRGLDSRGGCV